MEYSEVKEILSGGCEHTWGDYYLEGTICQVCADEIIIYIDQIQKVINEFIKTQEKYFQVPA